MEKNTCRKFLVLGIIFLFLGASVAVPNIKLLTGEENVFSVRATEISDGAPDPPSKPSGNTSGYICIDYNYSTNTTDPGGLNISYGWDWDGDLIVDEWTDWYKSNETCNISHFWWEPGEYNISVRANNTNGSLSDWSAQLNVTMQNHPPYEPSNPDPENGTTDVDINKILNWTGGDPDSCDDVTYDVYFGTNSTPPKVSSNQTGTSYDPGSLDLLTTYYWMIIAWDNHSASNESLIWNFTTRGNSPPNPPSNPSPGDGATNIDINADLSWTCSDPDDDTLIYDVYFEADDSSPDELVSLDQSGTTYEPGMLNYSTTYYWKIIAEDTIGESTEGSIWSFTTEAPPPPEVEITKPEERTFYLINTDLFPLIMNTIVYGPIDIEVNATSEVGIDRVEFYIDGELKDTVNDEPYKMRWGPIRSGRYTITAIAYDNNGQNNSDEIKVLKWRFHPILWIAAGVFMLRKIPLPFKFTYIRGTVVNLKRVGNEYRARAVRLHFTEFGGITRISGVTKLRKISFTHTPFIRTFDIGPLGLTTYVIGLVPGRINW
ncbi:MAG: hypothetical protein JSW60_03370 [Thermoplasmatales archaeon]|nr:MAG: hypothetical protein JSW60_03370 [Thermoplasmatales archaeon]